MSCSWSQGESIQSLTIKYVSCRFFNCLVGEVLFCPWFAERFIISFRDTYFYQMVFLAFLEIVMVSFFCLFITCLILLDIWILNHLCFPRIKLGYKIFFLYIVRFDLLKFYLGFLYLSLWGILVCSFQVIFMFGYLDNAYLIE